MEHGDGGVAGSGVAGSDGNPEGNCSDCTTWVSGMALSTSVVPGDCVTYDDKRFEFIGNVPIWDFNADCPPEGTRQSWCEASDYQYLYVEPCE